jgi:hypothetical protein
MRMRLSTYQIFRWYSPSRDGKELVENDERVDCPKLPRTEVSISFVADFLKNNRQIASRMIAESLRIPRAVFIRILEYNLGKRKDYFRMNIPKHVNFNSVLFLIYSLSISNTFTSTKKNTFRAQPSYEFRHVSFYHFSSPACFQICIRRNLTLV